jgi:4-hydroxythreonine-4-phosphate dehydrogenase
MKRPVPRIALTPGEPAGIGPDVVIEIAAQAWPVEIVVIADPGLLSERAGNLGRQIEIRAFDESAESMPAQAGRLVVAAENIATPAVAGRLDRTNATYVLSSLRRACAGCQQGLFSAMVTGPVHKALINEAGIPFSGHTEYLAELTDTRQPVMLLVADNLRVALVTTHMPLRDIPAAITQRRIQQVTETLNAGLVDFFGIDEPRIIVLGLNPHAGEGGNLGSEEIEIIAPALDALRSTGMQLTGPLPADTAFTPAHLASADAVLAMYHDQGLPVLKHKGFGRSVNVTLGLPIVRTSVDHGTALDLAATGHANPGSMKAALELAIEIQTRRT